MKRIKCFLIYSIVIALSIILFVSCGNNSKSDEIITEKGKMVEAFTAVNDAIPNLDNLSKGTITSDYTGFFMPAGNVMKDEIKFEKTEKGIHTITTETLLKGEPKVFNNVSNESISNTAYLILYPKEAVPKETFDKAKQLTVSKNEYGTSYRIDWLPNETEYSKSHFLQYTHSIYRIDNNGYLVEWSSYAKLYEKSGDTTSNVNENSLMVKLTDYSE